LGFFYGDNSRLLGEYKENEKKYRWQRCRGALPTDGKGCGAPAIVAVVVAVAAAASTSFLLCALRSPMQMDVGRAGCRFVEGVLWLVCEAAKWLRMGGLLLWLGLLKEREKLIVQPLYRGLTVASWLERLVVGPTMRPNHFPSCNSSHR
jgi:hypothetical protein